MFGRYQIANPQIVAFLAGIASAVPFAISVLVSFVVVASAMNLVGMSAVQAILFTLTTFAAPAQLVASDMLKNGAGIAEIALLVALINSRFSIMSISVLQYVVPSRRGVVMASLLMLSGSSFTVGVLRFRQQHPDSIWASWFLLGCCLCTFVSGFVGCLIGIYVAAEVDRSAEVLISTAVALLIVVQLMPREEWSTQNWAFVLLVIIFDTALRQYSPVFAPVIMVTLAPIPLAILSEYSGRSR